jgi:[acyl-carrier-protein] S-malonyltransferase
MMDDLAAAFPAVRRTFDEASEALDYDLWQLVSEGPAEELDRTERTQPAMLAADIATWRAYRSAGGPAPKHFAGHSLGEYAALVAADSLDFGDAIRLVAARGRFMQAAVPEGSGAMAAILGLEDETLERLCLEQAGDEVVACANYNAPGQVVIAGHRAAVERVCDAASEAGARRALPLPVSVPSHCFLMRDAAKSLAAVLERIDVGTPGLPVWHNVDVTCHPHPGDIRNALERQLWQPVQWTRTIQALAEAGVSRFVECGPGRVLAGLNRRILREAKPAALVDEERIRKAAADQ